MLAREFRGTLPKPSRTAKTPGAENGQFVTRLVPRPRNVCGTAQDLSVSPPTGSKPWRSVC